MNQEKQERIKACLQELSTLLYEEADKSKLTDLEGIGKTVRSQVLELVSPEIALFYRTKTGTKVGKTRKIKSLVGELKLKAKQLIRLGLKPRTRLSPLLQKCCLRLSANESYQKAEIEIEALTGVKVGHSTQQQLVLSQDFQLPLAKQSVSEVSVDGGKVRLRGKPKAGCHWRDYKTVRLQGIYYGAFFDDNQSLIDYVNSQQLLDPLVCLGDGHDGVWNLVREFGQDQFSRCEILDWYHLKENLYKVGGSLKRLKAAETLLWQGQVEAAKTLFNHCRGKQAKNFIAYLEKHLPRIVNYSYYQAEQLCSIGSGAVESAIKQIGLRIKISGAQWNVESVNHILSVRCAYLNGLLAV
ncbi:ISKra4-like element ISPle1 family transposase [Pleurocapsa sp. PCC 7327]|uniref:ISKra4-like element ISPle1 family transposase n=1 Tax=Pleurocapsa sp. PCC 7327 TaxID=118163 RepID=UPI001185013B|nr:ISKra4-like element ISPle1 family transposase [Pleurocapsa sp. PCC 7327]